MTHPPKAILCAICLLLIGSWAVAQVDIRTDDARVKAGTDDNRLDVRTDGMNDLGDRTIVTTRPADRDHMMIDRLPADRMMKDDGVRLYAIKRCDRWGFIDADGKFIAQAQFQEVRPFKEGLAAVKMKDRWGYINKEGSIVIKSHADLD